MCRVIGTLVGSVDKQCVEITNCFCVPHKEYEERVEADIVYTQVHYLPSPYKSELKRIC